MSFAFFFFWGGVSKAAWIKMTDRFFCHGSFGKKKTWICGDMGRILFMEEMGDESLCTLRIFHFNPTKKTLPRMVG